MRTFTFKGLFLTALLGCLSIQAADADLITKQITIKLEEAGTLPDKIGSSRWYDITNLKIVGKINGTDLDMIRDMAGISNRGNLSVLDLSEAKIVEGGDYYYYDNSYHDPNIYYDPRECYTSNDQIGRFAFMGCTSLTSLNLPDGITKIGYRAFEDCWNLTSLNLPDGITSIDNSAFSGCSRLTSLNLPSSITYISEGAFFGCSRLTSLNLPAGITSIGSYAFYGCSGLKSFTLPAGITEIYNSAFYGCI